MVKLTIIARVTDGLPLAEGLEHFREHNDFEFYKHKAKLLFNMMSSQGHGHGNGNEHAHGLPSRMSVRIEPYCFHYIIEDGVCYITLCDQSYPRKLAFHYLEDLQREFGKLSRSQIETASKPYAFIKFDSIIQRIRKLYLDTRTQRNLSKLNSDQIQVQQIITKDISEVLSNGDKHDEANDRATPSESRDIESTVKDSEILQKVAVKWMPIAVLGLVMIILVWARMVLWEI